MTVWWLASALALASAAHAITFSPGTKPDPFAPGKTCDAPQLASYGAFETVAP